MNKQNRKSYHFCFNRWSRTSYAAFNSLHKVVKMGVISVSLSLLIFSGQTLQAQPDTVRQVKTVEVDEVVVVSKRSDGLPAMARVTASVSKDEINALPVPDVNDVLRNLTGTDLRQRSPFGVQADLSVRGGNFDQTQVLLNGINFSDPQTGHYSLDLPIDLFSVSNIESLQGLSAPGAIGGAVNMSTIPQAQKGTATNLLLSGGQHRYVNLLGNVNISNAQLKSTIAASHKNSKGYTDNTDFKTTQAFAFAQYKTKGAGTFEGQLGYQNKAYGSNSFYSFKYPEQYEKTQTFLGSLRWHKQIGIANLSASAYARRHYDRFELFRYETPDWYKGHNYHENQVAGSEISLTLNTKLGKTTFTGEYRNEHIYSNVLGNPMDKPKQVPFEPDGIFYTKKDNRNILRGLLSHSVVYGNWGATVGLSVHHNKKFNTKYCWSSDTRYKLNRYWLVYAAFNQALRLPTFTDLYYQDAAHDANPNLKPEEATTIETGIRYSRKITKVSLSAYYRKGTDVIDWVYTEGTDKSVSLNHSRIEAYGIETAYHWIPELDKADNFIKQINISYAFVYLNKQSGAESTSYVLDYLRNKINFNISHSLGLKKLRADWQISLHSRAGNYVNFNTGATTPYSSFTLVNTKIQWKEPLFSIYAAATNVLGRKYYDYGGLQQPKLWFTAGIYLNL